MPPRSRAPDRTIATVADLLELATRRLCHATGTEVHPYPHSVGLALYLAHARVHHCLPVEQQRVGVDPDSDRRTGLELVSAAERAWRAVPYLDRPEGWESVLRDLLGLLEAVRALGR